MGLFDWLESVFGGAPKLPPRPISSTPIPATPIGSPRPPRPTSTPQPARRILSAHRVDYSAEHFLPLPKDVLREQAATVIRGGAWFGRRDQIPPAEDLRTNLIDRSLVAHGYLTAAQLLEIHRVGEQWRAAQGDRSLAAKYAQRAVELSRQEREQRKAEMKARAAERKRVHNEGVARRRASEIDYLGRGVSDGLADRTADPQKLTSLSLPLLATAAEVAASMSLPIPQLRWLAFHSDAASCAHYVTWEVPKKSGGMRRISAPLPRLRAAQEWILANVLSKLAPEPEAHGFAKGRSTVTNARVHERPEVLVTVDVKDFFPSITFPRVRGLFRSLGFSPAVATIFALLTTEAPREEATYDGTRYFVAIGPRGLPQGACTSPAISNLVTRRLDRRLRGMSKGLGWRYSRYADDLSFSATGEPTKRVGFLLARVRHVLEEEGFGWNDKKARVLRRNTAQRVTGIVVNAGTTVPRRERRRLRAILHHASKEGLARQNRENRPDLGAWLRGKIAYVSMVQPAAGAKLRAALDRLPR